jgi:hypothetical protein
VRQSERRQPTTSRVETAVRSVNLLLARLLSCTEVICVICSGRWRRGLMMPTPRVEEAQGSRDLLCVRNRLMVVPVGG